MKIKLTLITGMALAAVMLLSGCAAKSRLGYLIPAHQYSDQKKEEKIYLEFIPSRSLTEEQIEILKTFDALDGNAQAQVVPGPVIAFAAGLAIDYVKDELKKEAESYEAGFSKIIRLQTKNILPGKNYLIMARTVKDKTLNLADQSSDSSGVLVKEIQEIENKAKAEEKEHWDKMWDPKKRKKQVDEITQQLSGLSAASADHKTKSKLKEKYEDNIKKAAVTLDSKSSLNFSSTLWNKLKKAETTDVAFLLILEIEAYGNVPSTQNTSGPYSIRPVLMWNWKTKAKVVDFNLAEGWKVWQWVGLALLKTDSTVAYNVSLDMKALTQLQLKDAKTNLVSMVDITPTATLIENKLHNLDKPGITTYDKDDGAWFDVPVYHNDPVKNGFFTIKVSVTEKDASNTKQYLEKGVEKIEKNKESWIDKLKTAVD